MKKRDKEIEEDRQKRDAIRVMVSFPVYYKPIKEQGKIKVIKERYIKHKTSDREKSISIPSEISLLDNTRRRHSPNIDPVLLQLWSEIDKKLDIIISHIFKQRYIDKDAYSGICINISSGGLQITTENHVEVGTILDIHIELPTFPPFSATALARVVNLIKTTDNSPHTWKVSLEFFAINEDDKESLISYIFKRQRELLRSQSD